MGAVVVVRLVTHGSSTATSLPQDPEARAATAMLAAIGSLPPARPPALPRGAPLARLSRHVAALPRAHTIAVRDGVRISRAPFVPARAGAGRFVRLSGSRVGFRRLPLPPWYQTMQPGENELAPLAAGDVNGDGWPDVAVGTAYGVLLYVNRGGGRFALARTDAPQLRRAVVSFVSLTDLDGDGAPDLFSCAWMRGCSIAWNRAGRFSGAAVTELARGSAPAVHAAAFADVDRDGRVDIVTGDSTELGEAFSPRADTVTLWRNRGGRRLDRQVLPGPRGETLSLLFTDVDRDGWPDLYAGNDYDEPDVLFRNDHGRLRPVDKSGSPFPRSTHNTMSIDSGDLDNDGRPEIYEGAIAYGPHSPATLQRERQPPGASCRASYQDDAGELRDCLLLGEFQTAVARSRDITDVNECRHFSDPLRRRDCIGAGYLWNSTFAKLPRTAKRSVVMQACERIPPALATLHDLCAQLRDSPVDYGQSFKRLTDQVPQLDQTNLLFAPGPRGYADVTRRMGVAFGGWSWDAKFADLDNDTWQDLYVTQGTRLRFSNSSNLFYRNAGAGRGFRDEAARYGLEDHVPTGGALIVDLNQDGRLDLVTAPFAMTPVVWGNDLPAGPGLQVALRDDRSANRDAIGARLVIRSQDGRTQMRDIKASGGYQSQDLPIASFGLGDWGRVASLTVRWPDGTSQSFGHLSLRPGRYTLERLRS